MDQRDITDMFERQVRDNGVEFHRRLLEQAEDERLNGLRNELEKRMIEREQVFSALSELTVLNTTEDKVRYSSGPILLGMRPVERAGVDIGEREIYVTIEGEVDDKERPEDKLPDPSEVNTIRVSLWVAAKKDDAVEGVVINQVNTGMQLHDDGDNKPFIAERLGGEDGVESYERNFVAPSGSGAKGKYTQRIVEPQNMDLEDAGNMLTGLKPELDEMRSTTCVIVEGLERFRPDLLDRVRERSGGNVYFC